VRAGSAPAQRLPHTVGNRAAPSPNHPPPLRYRHNLPAGVGKDKSSAAASSMGGVPLTEREQQLLKRLRQLELLLEQQQEHRQQQEALTL